MSIHILSANGLVQDLASDRVTPQQQASGPRLSRPSVIGVTDCQFWIFRQSSGWFLAFSGTQRLMF